MSHNEPDPDLVRIGQSPEWMEWFAEALAYFEDYQPPKTAWQDRPWRPIGIRDESLTEIVLHNEQTRVGDDLVPLVRAAVRGYTISRYPWEFTP